jgi:hypothetical protein
MSKRPASPWVIRVKNASGDVIRLNVKSNDVLGDADLRSIAAVGTRVVGYESVLPDTLTGRFYAWVCGPQHRSFAIRVVQDATAGIWGTSRSAITISVGDPGALVYICLVQVSFSSITTEAPETIDLEYDGGHIKGAPSSPCTIKEPVQEDIALAARVQYAVSDLHDFLLGSVGWDGD